MIDERSSHQPDCLFIIEDYRRDRKPVWLKYEESDRLFLDDQVVVVQKSEDHVFAKKEKTTTRQIGNSGLPSFGPTDYPPAPSSAAAEAQRKSHLITKPVRVCPSDCGAEFEISVTIKPECRFIVGRQLEFELELKMVVWMMVPRARRSGGACFGTGTFVWRLGDVSVFLPSSSSRKTGLTCYWNELLLTD